MQSIFSKYKMMLEINKRRKTGKFTNLYKLNNIFLNNQWIKRRNTRELERKLGNT